MNLSPLLLTLFFSAISCPSRASGNRPPIARQSPVNRAAGIYSGNPAGPDVL